MKQPLIWAPRPAKNWTGANKAVAVVNTNLDLSCGWADQGMNRGWYGLANVPIKHHPTIGDVFFQRIQMEVTFKFPKKGHQSQALMNGTILGRIRPEDQRKKSAQWAIYGVDHLFKTKSDSEKGDQKSTQRPFLLGRWPQQKFQLMLRVFICELGMRFKTLLGGWATPLKNMNVNWDDDIPKNVFFHHGEIPLKYTLKSSCFHEALVPQKQDVIQLLRMAILLHLLDPFRFLAPGWFEVIHGVNFWWGYLEHGWIYIWLDI